MPGAEAILKEQLLLQQLIVSLLAHFSKQLWVAGKVSDLDMALERVKLLLTIKEQVISAVCETKERP